MRLTITVPTRVFLDTEASKINAEDHDGAFCILPRHVDFLTALAPGLFSYTTPDGEEVFLAVDEGILVKKGAEVTVATATAFRGEKLGALKEAVQTEFRQRSERQKKMHVTLRRLELDIMKHMFGEGREGHESVH